MSTRTADVHPQDAAAIEAGFEPGRDFTGICDFSPAELQFVLELAARVKASPAGFSNALAGKQVVLFFEKPSLRTRITFEAGVASLGGTSLFIDQTRAPLGAREKLSDIAHNLERWVHALVLRTFEHATVSTMAEHASIPVINGLSDREHPCQAMADFLTLQERFGDLSRIKLAYVGDGNNVANSLMLAAASLGSAINIATPSGYEPDSEILFQARELASRTGSSITLFKDPAGAVAGCDAVYTDVWASMGQEDEVEERSDLFAPYQVNAGLMSRAAPGAVFMHCLPAHRGDEVTDEVIDSPQSVVFDQAENRLHVQKAVLLLLLGGNMRRFPPRSARG